MGNLNVFLKSQNEIQAVKIIERTWCSYRDKQMFRLLKHAICAAVTKHVI